MSLWPDAVEVHAQRELVPYWRAWWHGFWAAIACCTLYAIAWGLLIGSTTVVQ